MIDESSSIRGKSSFSGFIFYRKICKLCRKYIEFIFAFKHHARIIYKFVKQKKKYLTQLSKYYILKI